MKRCLVLVSIILVTVGSLYALVHFIKMDRFEFAWLLNFMLMILAVPFTNNLNSGFSSSYFEEKDWERKGKLYEYFGINGFRKILIWIGWEKIIRKDNPINKDSKTLKHLYIETKKGELSHLVILIIVLGFNIFAAYKFGFMKTNWLFVLNIIFHLYPIFLQRYNRPRLKRALHLSDWRENKMLL